ncbi:DUF3987 domain-containing protein [Gemmata sp. G18]|uniref:DUF3987 domain-containing protein n=1 Tax=Gemmata palustris TaxID=2822762 RepID=A0ABS5BMA9_9BACT|nr:DUF3987 domain-containing protein [Gemmata palustris]MBP3954841.1 DUF3987 domain-containing protein [Gemmata palustris]
MSAITEAVERYRARGWFTVPVHRPDPDAGTCSCGKADCAKPGKHPDARFWPDGSAAPAHFAGRNLGIKLGPVSGNLTDVDLDCGEAVAAGPYLLPATRAAFGRNGHTTHALYTVPDGGAAFAKLQDPVLTGDRATIVELRWPEWDDTEQRHKHLQTVFPPSLHFSGVTLEWTRDGEPAPVPGAELRAAVRHVGAAVLVARYAKPNERHALVLLLANLLVRAGCESDARAVAFMTAVFAARNDPDKVAKITDGEGAGAVADARKRLKNGKSMTGLPALRAMLDPALDGATADQVVARVKEWLGVSDPPAPGAGATPGAPSPGPVWEPPVLLPEPEAAPPFPIELFPAPVTEYWAAAAAALHVPVDYVACPGLVVLGAAIGRARAAEVKPGYAESPLFWIAVVAPPGSAKSPALARARAPLDAAEARWRADHESARAAFEAEHARYELALKDWKKAPEGEPPTKPPKPALRQSVLDDTTTEAARRVLRDNPRGTAVLMDELTAFTRQLNQYRQGGRGADKTFWLSGWNGRGTCKNNRAGTHDEGPLVVSDPFTAVGGMLCPDSIGELREELRRGGAANDGWADRFLLSFPAPHAAAEESWATVPEPLARGYAEVLEALLALELVPVEGAPAGTWRPYYARFDGAARSAWQAFTRDVAARANALAPGDAYRGVLSKLKHYAVRFAALFHCLDAVCAGRPTEAPVGEPSVARAVRIVWYFEAQGRRCLGVGAPETQAARLLVPALAAWAGDRFTKRELHRKVRGQSAFRRAGHLDGPLKELAAHGYVRALEAPGAERGRPSEAFALNPLWDRSAPGGAARSAAPGAPGGSFLGTDKIILSGVGHDGPGTANSSTSGIFVHIVHAPPGGILQPPPPAAPTTCPPGPAPTAENEGPHRGMDNMDKNARTAEFLGDQPDTANPGQNDFVRAQKAPEPDSPGTDEYPFEEVL